jgi:transcriptional regulator with XRE-family HTH domain
VTEQPVYSLAELLRRLRTEAGLTQEELAQTARLSVRSVSDLERGINQTARKDTARLLANALSLTGPAREEFEATARGRPVAARFAPPAFGAWGTAARTLPRDIATFTGRESELRQLLDTVSGATGSDRATGVYAIDGMAGIGKTAFAVHAAHQLAPQFPDGQIFLPLHGHTPGRPSTDPADALASLLMTAGVAAQQIPPDLEARSSLWRHRVAGQRLLLVLDDAAGHEQVRPLLPGTAGSLVLVTSRRRLTALDDARTISLSTLPPDEAAELLIRLADREGLEPSDASVQEITCLCGNLPLAIGILARQLHHHPAWTAAGLAADVAAAQDRLAFMNAGDLSVAAAFDLSYQDLTGEQQRLFRWLGLYPDTDIDARAVAALDDTDLAVARRRLDALYDQHLLIEPSPGRYRLHDLIREHARSLITGDPSADGNLAYAEIERGKAAGHAFISYVREDSGFADELQQMLEAAGIRVWRDTADLWPGEDWRKKIRHAITQNALVFIACFSHNSVARKVSYQREELHLAIEQLRLRNPEDPWLIPVRFDNCDIPDLDIGGGRTLASIQRADIFGDHSSEGAVRLATTVRRILGNHSGA